MMPTYPDPGQIHRIIEEEARAEPQDDVPDPRTGERYEDKMDEYERAIDPDEQPADPNS